MQRTKNFFVRFLCLFLSVYMTGLPEAFAHTNTTNYGRVPITWPDLGHEGGALLQSRIVTGITQLSNNLLGRWTGDVTLANSASTTITHNFGLALTKLKVLVFDAGVQLTNAQVAAGYVITQVNTNSYTVQNVSGGSKTIQVITLAFKGGVDAADLDPAIAINTTGNVSATKVGAKANDIELNDAATGTGADYKATIRRPSTGMTGNTVITVPNITTTLIGRDSTDTLTNKTLSDSTFNGGTADNSAGANRRLLLPSNTLANLQGLTRNAGFLYYATDTAKVYYDNGSALLAVGSGSGSGGTNYITNGDYDTDASGTVVYKDAAAVTPVDGTGGSPTATFTRTTTLPLRGTGSGLLTKGASNLQGEGASIDFTVDRADLGKPINFKFDTETSANYTGISGNEYAIVQVYDVTNAALVTTTVNSIGQGKTAVNGWFLSSTSGSVYRLILHIAGTGTSAWTLKVDRLTVSDQTYLAGQSAQDWTQYTPTTAGFGTLAAQSFWYKIDGDSMYIRAKFTCGTTAATLASVSLPFNINSQAAPGAAFVVGRAQRNVSTASSVKEFTVIVDTPTSTSNVYFGIPDYTNAFSPISGRQGSQLFSNGEVVNFETGPIPVVGFSSNTQSGVRALDEFASNSAGNLDANDTTSFAYGTAGSFLPRAALTADRSRRVRYQQAIQPTDSFVLEIRNTSGQWLPLISPMVVGGTTISPMSSQGSLSYGIGSLLIVNSTDVDVVFAQYRSVSGTATYAAAGGSWANLSGQDVYWRLRKVSGGGLVGFPLGSRNIIADTSGTIIPSGIQFNETVSSVPLSSGVSLTTNVVSNITSITLTTGVYLVTASWAFDTSGSSTSFIGGVTKTSATLPSADTVGVPTNCEVRAEFGSATARTGAKDTLTTKTYLCRITSTSEVLYMIGRATFSTGTVNAGGQISAFKL